LGRKFIGIDTNPEYVEITLKRLKKIEKDKVKIYESKKVGMQLRLLEPKSKYLRNKKRSNKR